MVRKSYRGIYEGVTAGLNRQPDWWDAYFEAIRIHHFGGERENPFGQQVNDSGAIGKTLSAS